jgi:CRISPR/Cas system type I-B associated protein Csh2 (Cas7 group RAMP superfamily)
MIPLTVTFKSTETHLYITKEIEVKKVTRKNVEMAIWKMHSKELRKLLKFISFKELKHETKNDTIKI